MSYQKGIIVKGFSVDTQIRQQVIVVDTLETICISHRSSGEEISLCVLVH